ncbi:MAG TPA: hypothetical protein VFX14_19555, partial [Methylomirabilota bacterium]|nr:hypothetical protein [Methylomirabilota bacterium]
MRKLWLMMLCTLAFLGTATVSEAKIFVTISDGTTTLDGRSTANGVTNGAKGFLLLLKASPAPTSTTGDFTDTLNIL